MADDDQLWVDRQLRSWPGFGQRQTKRLIMLLGIGGRIGTEAMNGHDAMAFLQRHQIQDESWDEPGDVQSAGGRRPT